MPNQIQNPKFQIMALSNSSQVMVKGSQVAPPGLSSIVKQ